MRYADGSKVIFMGFQPFDTPVILESKMVNETEMDIRVRPIHLFHLLGH